MDTVISPVMCDSIHKNNGMMIYHRFCSFDDKIEIIRKYPNV